MLGLTTMLTTYMTLDILFNISEFKFSYLESRDTQYQFAFSQTLSLSLMLIRSQKLQL